MTDSTTIALGDLLDAFASSDPLPGGGAAAALTAALGTSLLMMIAGMSRTRRGTPEETADLSAAATRLRHVREELTGLIDHDAEAYRGVLFARRQPKGTEAEVTARIDAVERAMRAATDVPLMTLRACERALTDAPGVIRFGNPNAVADAVVGTRLLLAAAESAALNIRVNLPGVKDPAYVADAEAQRESLLRSAVNLARQAADSQG